MGVFTTTIEVLERLSTKTGKSVMMLAGTEDKLKSICAIFDDMISEFDAETYTVTVEPGDLMLEINLMVQEMIIEDCVEHGFYKLTEMCDSFTFFTEDDGIVFSIKIKNLFYIAK